MPLIFRLVLFGLALLAAARAAEARFIADVSFLAPDRTEKLDIFLPTPPPDGKLSPAVVWIHGGGWTGGKRDEARAKNICGTLAAAGYVAVSTSYRLGDGAWPRTCTTAKTP